MKKKTFITVGIILFLVCSVVGGMYYLQNYEKVYYAKIDNTKIKKISTSDDMKYEYALDCYNKIGRKRKLKFKVSRELKESAYILLEVRTFGVHKWEEVQYNDLPKKVREKIN